MRFRRSIVSTTVLLVATVASAAPTLTQVASFDHEVTGVSVAKDGRIFVNFPRWTEDAPVSVAEVMKDGSIKPFPDEEWNSWRNAKKDEVSPDKHWVCVQSVVVDPTGTALWVLDPASPATAGIIPHGPKLVKIDLANNAVAQTIAFDETVAIPGSYLNDVRFSEDVRYAYITDSGNRGAIVVVDLQSGKARRVLDGDPRTQPEKGVVVHTDGKELRRPDGRTATFASDGIELSKDGQTLYWQALTGKTLYALPTNVLTDASKSPEDIAAAVKPAGENGVSDGLWLDANNKLYISAVEEDAIKTRTLGDGEKATVLIQDKRLRWPDTFSMGPDGALYVTASHIQDSAWYKPGAPIALKTELFKITQ